MKRQAGHVKCSGCVARFSEAEKQELDEVTHDAISHRLQQDEVSALKFVCFLSLVITI